MYMFACAVRKQRRAARGWFSCLCVFLLLLSAQSRLEVEFSS